MSVQESPRVNNLAWRAAEIIEETERHSADTISRRIVKESGLDWDVHGPEARQVVDEVMSGARVVDLRRTGSFSG